MTFDLDPNRVKMNQHARYLSQMSESHCPGTQTQTHTDIHTQTQTHTHRTDCFIWSNKAVGKNVMNMHSLLSLGALYERIDDENK